MPLPPTRYIKAGPMLSMVSAETAMAPGKALESAGASVTGAADDVASFLKKTTAEKSTPALQATPQTHPGIDQQIQSTSEDGVRASFMANLDKDKNDHSTKLAKSTDGDSSLKSWRDLVSEKSAQIDALKLSPQGTASLKKQLADFSARSEVEFDTEAKIKTLGIARGQFTGALEYYAATGNRDGFETTLNTSKFLQPHEKDAAWNQYYSQTAAMDLYNRIQKDPQGTLAALDKPDEYLKANRGTTHEMLGFARLQAEHGVEQKNMSWLDQAHDAMARGTLRAEEVDARFPQMRQANRDTLKAAALARTDPKFRAQLATTDYQNEAYGKVGGLLATYSPAAKNQDETYGEMLKTISPLPAGPLKDTLLKRMQDVRQGKPFEIKTHADQAQQVLDTHFKGHLETAGKIEPLLTEKAVRDGYFKDTIKLTALGFSPEQVSEITSQRNNQQSGAVFTRLWAARPNAGKETADPITLSTADAILHGRREIGYVSPGQKASSDAALRQMRQSYGSALQKMATFFKLTPKATSDQIEDKLLNITGESAHSNAVASIRPNARPPGKR